MGSPYAGNPANFPSTFIIPADSDPPTASAFNVAAEALGDRTAWLYSNMGGHPIFTEFLGPSLASFTLPAYADPWILVEGCGGGGGGGGGTGNPGIDAWTSGGGGGGGAQRSLIWLPVTVGVQYDVFIGAGGNGGAGGGSGAGGSAGADGGPTSILLHSNSNAIVSFQGGAGGQGGQIGLGGAQAIKSYGGPPVATGSLSLVGNNIDTSVTANNILLEIGTQWIGIPGHGGAGLSGTYPSWVRALPGAGALQSFNTSAAAQGGRPGVANATSSGSYRGGGQGGGGGAGGYSLLSSSAGPSSGGFGGTPNNAGASTGTSQGVAGTANTGDGGGGGGSSGGATTGSSGLNAGAAGGSGRCRVIWFAKTQHP